MLRLRCEAISSHRRATLSMVSSWVIKGLVLSQLRVSSSSRPWYCLKRQIWKFITCLYSNISSVNLKFVPQNAVCSALFIAFPRKYVLLYKRIYLYTKQCAINEQHWMACTCTVLIWNNNNNNSYGWFKFVCQRTLHFVLSLSRSEAKVLTTGSITLSLQARGLKINNL